MILTPDPNGVGLALFTGAQQFRSHDDASDNKVGTAYSHIAVEFSATEMNEIVSLLEYMVSVMQGGSTVASTTVPPGQVFAGPSEGGNGVGGYRYLTEGDMPSPVKQAGLVNAATMWA